MSRILLFISLITLISLSSFGQKFYFENYSVNEGLAQSKVYDIIQDKNGFIWTGTASGVSKFEGNNFINYSSDNGLAENGVRSIYQDKRGYIWFGHSGGGISFFDGKKFNIFITDSIEIKGDITGFLEDSKGRFWIASQGSGALLIDNFQLWPEIPASVTQFTGKTKLGDRVFFITENTSRTIFFIIDNLIKTFNEETKSFDVYRQEGLSFYFQPTVMFEDKDQNLWFGTYKGGLLRQDFKTGNVTIFDDKRDGLADNWVSCINQDNKGAIWVGTWGGGISRINPNFTTFNTHNGLPENKIWKIINDREGNVLIGTNENGLSIFKGEQFISFHPENGLTSEQVTAISEDNQNNIWIGTNEGLCKYNLSSKRIKPVAINELAINSEVIGIKKTNDGTIWIATKEDGIYTFDPINGDFDYNPGFNYEVVKHGRIVTCLEIDHEGHIWVGTIGGLFYLESENNAYTLVVHGEISSIYFDTNNIMWVGTKGKGVISIDDIDINPIKQLEKVNALCFTEDVEGNIWIGTEGQGITLFTKDSTSVKYKTRHGLLSDFVSAITTDKVGNIWIGTNKGLNKYEFKADRFYSYTEKSGFTGIEVKHQALFTDFDGNIYCGTIDGLFKFSPEKENINNLEPIIKITNLKVNLKNRKLLDGMRLSYKEKNILFEYHGICLSDAEKVRYQVMLEGADEDWLPPTTNTLKNYSPLPPGRYTFKVKACNNRGIWNETPAEFSFVVQPPFYLTWWFILILVILIILAIIFYINIRERNLKKEKIVLEQKVQERTQEVVKKNQELAKKNQDILDSINYAKRIQQVILPAEKTIQKHFPQSFVLFKPKDIVSGDFYWFKPLEDRVLFSAIDCTGHGVPGAFMSIMGHDGLKRAVGEYCLNKPHDILEKLNEIVEETLKSNSDNDVKDGMDMALCVYYPESKKLEFSGANNPIYIIRSEKNGALIRNGEPMEPTMTNYGYNLFETKPNKQPIGPYINRVPFVMHNFDMLPGDSIYIFSDGYADQFGGNKGRKFMYKNFKDTLLKNQEIEMKQQKVFYNQIINAWMGNYEQIDDICLMGVRI